MNLRKTASILTGLAVIFSTLPVFADSITVTKRNGDTVICDFADASAEGDYEIGYSILDDTNKTVCAEGFTKWPAVDGSAVIIPAKVKSGDEEYTVTRIGTEAFRCNGSTDEYKNRIGSVELPDTVIQINNNAFSYNYSLKTFSCAGEEGQLPEGLAVLGSGAFYSCETLAVDLKIPSSLENISDSAFNNCYEIKTITIAEGVKKIGNEAFRNVRQVSELKIPASVTEVNLGAFIRMQNMTKLSFKGSDAISFTGTADTKQWKYPSYPNIGTYGGCMGGRHAAAGYTKFYAKNETVLSQLKNVITAPIVADDDTETQKCKEYFEENNFFALMPSVTITSPAEGADVTTLPLKVSGNYSEGDKVGVSINGGEEVNAVINADGTWSCEITNVPDGEAILTAVLYDGADSVANAEINITLPETLELNLPRIFAEHMVLQRNEKVSVWGSGGAPGDTVTVTILEGSSVVSEASAVIDGDNKWSAELPPMEAGGPYIMKVTGTGVKPYNTAEYNDVMIGEVWLASGQSNMAFTISILLGIVNQDSYQAPYNGDKEKLLEELWADRNDPAKADDDKLRMFTVGELSSDTPCEDVNSGEWIVSAAGVVGPFSSTAYYFAKYLKENLGGNIAVGVVVSAVGGSGIERWVDKDIIQSDSSYERYNNSIKKPGTFYNGMINPVKNYTYKGAIWYQGESNADETGEPDVYAKLFPDMISNWRESFNNPDMPFLFVNLAPFTTTHITSYGTFNYDFASLREAQLKTLLSVPNTAMAVITDAGDPKDIHPADKRPVAKRLAAAAMAKAYGRETEYSGPLYSNMICDGNKLTLTFEHTGTGLTTLDSSGLRGFEISADGENFVTANAEINGNKVDVWADGVTEPIAVRYAWSIDDPSFTADSPVAATLQNNEGFPAVPFRARLNDYSIESVRIYADGNEITDKLPESSSTDIEIDYKNSSCLNTALCICVFDKEGMLKDIKLAAPAFDWNSVQQIRRTVDTSGAGADGIIKLISLENLRSIRPILPCQTIPADNN